MNTELFSEKYLPDAGKLVFQQWQQEFPEIPETCKPLIYQYLPHYYFYADSWTILRLFRTFLSTSKRRIFQVSKGRQFLLLEKFSAKFFQIQVEFLILEIRLAAFPN